MTEALTDLAIIAICILVGLYMAVSLGWITINVWKAIERN